MLNIVNQHPGGMACFDAEVAKLLQSLSDNIFKKGAKPPVQHVPTAAELTDQDAGRQVSTALHNTPCCTALALVLHCTVLRRKSQQGVRLALHSHTMMPV